MGAQEFASFVHRSKCFSVVTNTYMTYDFICFNAETTHTIVHTLRGIIHQSRELSSKMAIRAKANRKYLDGMNQTPLVFHNTLSALTFEIFVLVLQNSINKIGSELNIDIPSAIESQANASLLYPILIEEDIPFSEWQSWCRTRLSDSLSELGYYQQDEDTLPSHDPTLDDVDSGSRSPRKVSWDTNLEDESHDEAPTRSRVVIDKHRRQSSLFGVKAFPMDESYDLFAGNLLSGDDTPEPKMELYQTQAVKMETTECLMM